jgi:hypothetical protein
LREDAAASDEVVPDEVLN